VTLFRLKKNVSVTFIGASFVFISSHASATSEAEGCNSYWELLLSQFDASKTAAIAKNALTFFRIYGYNKSFMSNIQSAERKPAILNIASILKIAAICLVSGLLNMLLSHFINGVCGLPLYLDTLFTVAVYFSIGLFPALITAVLLPVFTTFEYTRLMNLAVETAWWTYPFVLCAIFEVLLIFFFRNKLKPIDAAFRKNPSLYAFINLAPLLMLIAVLNCIVVSVTGGIIDYILTLLSAPKVFYPEDSFKIGLLRNNVSLLASSILSRIPINIVDRFFVIFGGYGVSLVYGKILGK
jgi:energy-coupling factor transport system substrate-specific component